MTHAMRLIKLLVLLIVLIIPIVIFAQDFGTGAGGGGGLADPACGDNELIRYDSVGGGLQCAGKATITDTNHFDLNVGQLRLNADEDGDQFLIFESGDTGVLQSPSGDFRFEGIGGTDYALIDGGGGLLRWTSAISGDAWVGISNETEAASQTAFQLHVNADVSSTKILGLYEDCGVSCIERWYVDSGGNTFGDGAFYPSGGNGYFSSNTVQSSANNILQVIGTRQATTPAVAVGIYSNQTPTDDLFKIAVFAHTSGSTEVGAVFANGEHQIGRIQDPAPTENISCVAARVGTMVYVDETDDGARATICVCIDTDDGTTFDWKPIDDLGAVSCEI